VSCVWLRARSIDVDLPYDVDDEYWEPLEGQAFVQPPGKPSKLSKFVYHLRLHHIINYTMRTVVRLPEVPLDMNHSSNYLVLN
jgi:hypothetical protein